MKTIEYWLRKLPKGYRERALGARKKQGCNQPSKTKSLIGALVLGFYWNKTNEGKEFWYAVYTWACHKKSAPQLPPLPKRKRKSK